jgi:ketosteroid isomerase-like protein
MSSANFWRKTASRIPSATSRAHIEATARAYIASWNSGDVTLRLSLFSETIHLEDPAPIVRATNREELRAFFTAGIPADWQLQFAFIRIVVSGDEAILTYETTLTVDEQSPATLLINTHMRFDSNGLITSFRTFFDAEAITE